MQINLTPPPLQRYTARILATDGKVFGHYTDWFTDDADARATFRVILEQQGYTVKSITLQDQPITVPKGHNFLVEIQ